MTILAYYDGNYWDRWFVVIIDGVEYRRQLWNPPSLSKEDTHD